MRGQLTRLALSPLIWARPEQSGLRLAIFVHDQREAYCTADREWTEIRFERKVSKP